MRRALILPQVVAVALAAASVARAYVGVPYPNNSHVDACIVDCPLGDSVLTVNVHDFYGWPISNIDVVVDFFDCPNVHLQPSIPPGQYQLFSLPERDGCCVLKVTNMFGRALIPIVAGGACTGAEVRVYASGMLLGSRPVASFDLDGDLGVTEADLALVTARLGTTDRAADYDCDGSVTPADYQIASLHLGHVWSPLVGVGPGGDVAFGVSPAVNPTAGATDFVVRSPWRGRAVLALYDLSGRRLATVLDRDLEAGTVTRATWSGRDAGGRPAAQGIYFYRLTIGSHRAEGTLIVAR